MAFWKDGFWKDGFWADDFWSGFGGGGGPPSPVATEPVFSLRITTAVRFQTITAFPRLTTVAGSEHKTVII